MPASLYCFLSHPDCYEDCLHCAIFAGGDTDTIGSMAGALSGARLGLEAIPRRWLGKVREDDYTVGKIAALSRKLWELREALAAQSNPKN